MTQSHSSHALPRPEHPRPDSMRSDWINLNGEWDFAFDPDNIGEQKRWYRDADDYLKLKIIVPYPWESTLSGVCAHDYRGAGWYRRSIEIPRDWLDQGLHPILRFGAVDWNAKVWVNGRLAAEHDGGFSPFEVDLYPFVTGKVKPVISGSSTGAANPLQPVITVRAWDVCAADTPLGKQVKEWYTPSSGIWQTVWMEGRESCHISSVEFTPDIDGNVCAARLFLEVDEPGEYGLRVESVSNGFPAVEKTLDLPLGRSEQPLDIPVPDARLWSPEDPHLYEVRVRLTSRGRVCDTLASYFGMRKVSRGTWGGSEHEYVLLNDQPIYLRGVLDQAFHPESLYSYPTDDDVRADVEAARDLGFNLLRCHIKVNDPRYYYWADRLGMLVMSDMPSTKLYSAVSRRNWELTFRDAVARDFNHPSIIAWILFNETWGLEEHETEAGWRWVKQMYQLCRALDPSRLAEDNSACLYDHVATDLNSWHFYLNDYDRARRHISHVVASTLPGSPFNYVGGGHVQSTEPLLNSEYGGIGAHDGDRDISYCFKYLTADLRRHEKIVGYVYTELADIEWEHNGLLNYDRSPKECGYAELAPGMTPAAINSPDFIGVDAPPCQTAGSGTQVELPFFFSHFGSEALQEVRGEWRATFLNSLAETREIGRGEVVFRPKRFGVCVPGAVSLTMPDEAGLVTVVLEAVAESSRVVGRHYVQIEVHDQELSSQQKQGHSWVLRWSPGDLCATEWSDIRVSRKGRKLTGRSYGSVEYEVVTPEELDLDKVTGIRLLFEAGAATAPRRLDWKDQIGRLNYPQTDVLKKYPSKLLAQLNGVTIGEITLPDDPADARGVLSHHNEPEHPGAYGFLVDINLDHEQVEAVTQRAHSRVIRVRLEAPKAPERPGGLSLYGRRVGRYPVDPTLVLTVGG